MNILEYIILPTCIILASCQKESGYVDLKWEDTTLTIQARINPSPAPLTNAKAKVRAHLSVINRSRYPQEFGNRFLILHTADGKQRRTYLDTLESRDIDYSTATIGPFDSLVIEVFWVFRRADKLSYQSITFDRAGVEQFLHGRKR